MHTRAVWGALVVLLALPLVAGAQTNTYTGCLNLKTGQLAHLHPSECGFGTHLRPEERRLRGLLGLPGWQQHGPMHGTVGVVSPR